MWDRAKFLLLCASIAGPACYLASGLHAIAASIREVKTVADQVETAGDRWIDKTCEAIKGFRLKVF
jgi:hypothetical protein